MFFFFNFEHLIPYYVALHLLQEFDEKLAKVLPRSLKSI